jgi:NADH dehydrogenase [ubiquinone] 1 alpha subcomplex assembly factor 1
VHKLDRSKDFTMPTLIHRFDAPTTTQNWQPINDRVMGGVSTSRMSFDLAGHAVFEGTVSLENNGGFASVRTPLLDLGCADTAAYALTVCGDGHTYKLNLRTDTGFDGLNYQAAFKPVLGQWSQIYLPVAVFVPSFRGRTVQGAAPLQPELVRQVGLMISDRQAGPFRLAVKAIEAIPISNRAS